MTTEQRKEETRKKFEKFCNDNNSLLFVDKRSKVFNFFYSEIEARDRRFDELLSLWNPMDEYVRPLTPLGESVSAKALELVKRVERLEEIIKAADEVIKCYPKEGLSEKYGYDHEQALEKYNKLKSKT